MALHLFVEQVVSVPLPALKGSRSYPSGASLLFRPSRSRRGPVAHAAGHAPRPVPVLLRGIVPSAGRAGSPISTGAARGVVGEAEVGEGLARELRALEPARRRAHARSTLASHTLLLHDAPPVVLTSGDTIGFGGAHGSQPTPTTTLKKKKRKRNAQSR